MYAYVYIDFRAPAVEYLAHWQRRQRRAWRGRGWGSAGTKCPRRIWARAALIIGCCCCCCCCCSSRHCYSHHLHRHHHHRQRHWQKLFSSSKQQPLPLQQRLSPSPSLPEYWTDGVEQLQVSAIHQSSLDPSHSSQKSKSQALLMSMPTLAATEEGRQDWRGRGAGGCSWA